MTTINFTLPDVSCGHCKMSVERQVGEMEGVASVLVTVDKKQAAIQYDAPATSERIEALLAEIGFPPRGG